MKLINLILISVVFCIHHSNSARILGVFPIASKSHSILGQALFKELASRGHEVYYLSPYPLKNPPKNYHDLELTEEGILSAFAGNLQHLSCKTTKIFFLILEEIDTSFEVTDLNPIFMFKQWALNTEKMAYSTLIDPAVQKLLNDKSQKFDLIILDLLFNEALIGKN